MSKMCCIWKNKSTKKCETRSTKPYAKVTEANVMIRISVY